MNTSPNWKWLSALAVAFVLLFTACGSDDGDDDAAASSDASETAEAADLQLSSTDLGDVLTDADGNTVYLFAPDNQGDSTCYDACEASWPVVGELSTVGDGLDASLLGTTERTTGDTQATYNGWPLYYFANDGAPGDTNGQGANDVWWVLDAQGNAVAG